MAYFYGEVDSSEAIAEIAKWAAENVMREQEDGKVYVHIGNGPEAYIEIKKPSEKKEEAK